MHADLRSEAGKLFVTSREAHEIRQPLAAITTFGNASINWLKHKTPDLDEVRSNLDNMVKQVYRVDDVIKSVTALFKKESTTRRDVNLNELVQQVLTITSRAIDSNKIVLETNFIQSRSRSLWPTRFSYSRSF